MTGECYPEASVDNWRCEVALKSGSRVPEFRLTAGTGEVVDSRDLGGHPWVIYFYPKDHTSGCTIETRAFGRLLAEFRAAGAAVYGCSVGDVDAKRDFAASCGVPDLPLLADPDHQVAEMFGSWGPRPGGEGVHRNTFLVDSEGVVVRSWTGVQPEGHAEDVLQAVRELASSD